MDVWCFQTCLLSVLLFILCVDSARILGLFTFSAKSHLIVHTAIVEALVERGHNVTVVTTVSIPRKNTGYRHINLDIPHLTDDFFSELIRESLYKRFPKLMNKVTEGANASLNHPLMRELMQTESFDLVVLGYFFNEFQLGVAAHFKCPVVVSFTVQPVRIVNDLVGNPRELAYVPNLFTGNMQPLDFWGRVKNFIFVALFEEIIIPYWSNSRQRSLYDANFPPDKYPSLDEMKKNVSLVLANHHFTQGPIRPNVPALIEVGGIQVKDKPDPLPEDLKSILDNAKNGVIYFCFGSNIAGSVLKKDKVKVMFNVVSKLPYTVLWKWGDSDFPGQSPNIIYRSWVPQDDVLAHPNIKLFITHGGQGSLVESQYRGIPVVGIPLFSEQHANMARIHRIGYGLMVDYATLSEETLSNAVQEVLTNSRYRDNVQRFARLYRDRPMTAKETVVYWVDYVLRHHGAPHMQSPAVHMNRFQLMSFDVIGFLLVVMISFVVLVKITCSFIVSRCTQKKSKQE